MAALNKGKKRNTCCDHGYGCGKEKANPLDGIYENLGPATPETKDWNISDVSKETSKKEFSKDDGSSSSVDGSDPSEPRRRVYKQAQPVVAKANPLDGIYEPIGNFEEAVSPKKSSAKARFLGIKTWEEAEKEVGNDIKLYHQKDSGADAASDLQPVLPLFAVYVAKNKVIKHYRVASKFVGGSPSFFLEHGDPKAPTHASLEELLCFYEKKFLNW